MHIQFNLAGIVKLQLHYLWIESKLLSELYKFSIDAGIQSQLFVARQSLKIFRKFVRW